MEALDIFNLACGQLNVFKRHLPVFERDASAKSVRQRARLIMDLLEHEMRKAAFTRRHRVPSDFLNGSLNGFAFTVEQAIGAQRDFANFAVFEKGDSARVIQ